MVRIEATAEDSLAAMRERSKFGIAIAAIIKIIATTIKSSISEKPFCFFICGPSLVFPILQVGGGCESTHWHTRSFCATLELTSRVQSKRAKCCLFREEAAIAECAVEDHLGEIRLG